VRPVCRELAADMLEAEVQLVTLAFRNLTITPEAPVSEWPTEAVQTALERGDLADWHRIVSAIRADPWGKTRAVSWAKPVSAQ
jgi:hypothetical protein